MATRQLKAVEQANTAFYINEDTDPTESGATFLTYDPQSNSYRWTGYEQMVAATQQEYLPQIDPFLRGTGEVGASGEYTPPDSTGDAQEFDIHMAATFGGAMTDAMDVMGNLNISPASAALSAITGVRDFQKGVTRAETFARARTPSATIKDLLGAYQQKPSGLEVVGSVLKTGLSAYLATFAGPKGVLSAISSATKTASTFSARGEADEALQRAGEMERQAAATGSPLTGGFGYVNTIPNWEASRQTNIAPASPTRTIQDAVSQIRTESFSDGGSFSQDFGANRDVASERESSGYTPSSSDDRRGFTGRDRDTDGNGGEGGGPGGGSSRSGGESNAAAGNESPGSAGGSWG